MERKVSSTKGGPTALFPAIISYGPLATFFLVEGALRRGAAAKALDATMSDRGTTRTIGIAFLSCLVSVMIAPVLSRLGIGRFGSPTIAWTGLGGMVLGMSLRVWANQTLGTSYTRTLKTMQGQSIVSNGPYRVLRHPGYGGVLLMWLGAGVALRNWVALGFVALLLGLAYRRRMNAEEEMLLTNFGVSYRDYCRRTWRIIPFLY